LLRSPKLGACALSILPVVAIINKFYGDWLKVRSVDGEVYFSISILITHMLGRVAFEEKCYERPGRSRSRKLCSARDFGMHPNSDFICIRRR
jgi:hypothetical protein